MLAERIQSEISLPNFSYIQVPPLKSAITLLHQQHKQNSEPQLNSTKQFLEILSKYSYSVQKNHNEIALHIQSNVAVIAEVITFASLLPLSRAQQYEREDH